MSKDQGATALASYLRQACDAAEEAGSNAIRVCVPKAFNLPLWEAREIAARLEESTGLHAKIAALKALLAAVESHRDRMAQALADLTAEMEQAP